MQFVIVGSLHLIFFRGFQNLKNANCQFRYKENTLASNLVKPRAEITDLSNQKFNRNVFQFESIFFQVGQEA